ncbi:MAG: phospholipid-binding protein MlaC [Syntrophales bacterium]
MKLKLIHAAILFCILSTGLHGNHVQAMEDPTAMVRRMLERVMTVQTDPRLQGRDHRNQRREDIKKIIAQNFNFDLMAQQAIGSYWQKLNEAEQREFTDIFRDLFQDSYTKLVLDFLKRENILYTKEELLQDQALVKTKIIRTNEAIPVDYSLILVRGKWLVKDVSIDGVSIVGNYRKSFTRVIQRESYPALLSKMRLQRKAVEKSSRRDQVQKVEGFS